MESPAEIKWNGWPGSSGIRTPPAGGGADFFQAASFTFCSTALPESYLKEKNEAAGYYNVIGMT